MVTRCVKVPNVAPVVTIPIPCVNLTSEEGIPERAMTADATKLTWPVLERIRDRILEACPTVTKVLYDLTGKPPSTIEYI